MRANRERLFSLMWVALVLAVGTACFSETVASPASPEVECGQPDGAGVFIVETRNFAFDPDTVRVPAGAIVVWLNCEPEGNRNEPHTTTADDGAWVFALQSITATAATGSATTNSVPDSLLAAGYYIQYHVQMTDSLPAVACGTIN